MRTRKPLNHGKVRQSLYGAFCAVCLEDIEPGSLYYDTGACRRAHLDCGNAAEMKPDLEHSKSEQAKAQEKLYRERARLLMREEPEP